MDNAIAKLGEYTDIGTDAVFLEREHAKIPEIKSIIVDFPLTMLFSVKEVQCKSNGARKSHPAIRFHLKGSKPTQNLYFHSGKSTMLRFYEELEKHILLHRLVLCSGYWDHGYSIVLRFLLQLLFLILLQWFYSQPPIDSNAKFLIRSLECPQNVQDLLYSRSLLRI